MSESVKKKVLIVDDAQYVRDILKKIVEKTDFAEVVGEASNGNDAVILYEKLKPDLVTMDLVMPNSDGIKAIEEIIKIDKNATVIVISAVGHEMSIQEATLKGAKDYITKPFKKEQIYDSIKRFLKP